MALLQNASIAVICVATSATQSFCILIASSVASNTFLEYNGTKTDGSYSLYLVWFSWLLTIATTVNSIVALWSVIVVPPNDSSAAADNSVNEGMFD